MAPTLATQLRTAEIDGVTVEYVVTSTVTDRGDLPDFGAFVLEIIDEDDPKQDILARVATPADLAVLATSRALAVTNEASFFRSSSVINRYENINTAIAGKDFLQERVNALVVDYQAFIDVFLSDPAENLSFPAADIGILTPAISAYTEKRDERTAQDTTVTEKQASCDELQDTYDDAAATEADANTTLSALERSKTALTAGLNALTAIQSASTSLATDIVAAISTWNNQRVSFAAGVPRDTVDDELLNPTGALYVEYYDTGGFEDAVVTLSNSISTITAEIAAVTTQISAQTTIRDAATTAKNEALTALETCTRELSDSQQVQESLEREETRLLAEVVDLCPAYSPPTS